MSCPCPRPDDLLELISDEPGEESVRAHARVCARCQRVLDDLSDDPELSGLIQDRGVLRERPAHGPGLNRAITALHRAGWELCAGSGADESKGTGYPFLAAPRHAGDLGTLDGYAVRSELGRGGMGIVLLGFDETLHRAVALKVLRPDLGDEASRKRFVREARAAARIRHDHVVDVYAVVSRPGVLPYCVLEYLAGPSLSARIKEDGRLAPGEAAAVAAQVAAGLAAAHAAGLIHRDVKPSNVLFDPGTGRAKLVDFGLARAFGLPSSVSTAGGFAGTPAYMSPEQVRGADAIGPACDLYGLGVTLYEMLTGTVPFPGATPAVLQQLLHDDPRPPRALNAAVPRDLETICVKCLEKDPSQRYSSAVALGDDLRRFLAGEPIAAKPVPRWARWARHARRRPLAAMLGVSSILTALALVIGGVVDSVRLRIANERAAENLHRADRHFESALAAVNRMLSRVEGEHLPDLPELSDIRRAVLADAAALVDQLARDPVAAARPSVRLQLADAHRHLGLIHERLTEPEPAAAEYRLAIDVQQRLAAEFPGRSDYQRELAITHGALGALLGAQHRANEAEAELRAAQALWGPLSQSDPAAARSWAFCAVQLAGLCQLGGQFERAEHHASDALRRLDQLPPGDADSAGMLANALVQLANMDFLIGKADDAERLYRRSLALCDARGREPDSEFWDALRASCYEGLGTRYGALQRFDEAGSLLGRALAIRERAAARWPKAPGPRDALALALNADGLLRLGQGRASEALALLGKSVEIREQLVREHPQPEYYRRRLAEAYLNLGSAYQAAGRWAETRSAYGKAIPVVQTIRAEHPGDPVLVDLQASILTNLGLQLTGEGRPREALERLNEAVSLVVSAYGPSPEAANARNALYKASGARAQAHSAAGEHAAAVPDWDRVVALAQPGDRDQFVLIRCIDRVRAGDWRRAADEAEALASGTGRAAELIYNAACVLAVASAAGNRAGDAKSARLARHDADSAIALLKRIARDGFFRSEAARTLLETDRDLDALAGRPDFEHLRLDAAFPADPFQK